MRWPTCPFKFAGGEQCQRDLGHEKRGEPDHRHEQFAHVESVAPGQFRMTGYRLLIESASAPKPPTSEPAMTHTRQMSEHCPGCDSDHLPNSCDSCAGLRDDLAAAEAREAELREALVESTGSVADCAYCNITESRPCVRHAALSQKPDTFALSAALASEWERAYRAGAEAVCRILDRRAREPGLIAVCDTMADAASEGRALPVPPHPEEGKT